MRSSHRRSRGLSTFRKRRAGVSEIIGALLMLLVVVGLSTVIFAFATNSVGAFSTNFSNLFSSSSSALTERLVVEQVTFNETGTSLGANIYVRSVGSLPVTAAAVYATNVTTNSLFLSKQLSPTTQLNPEQFQDIALSFVPDSGAVYSFTIAAQNGNTVTVDAKAQ